MLSASSCERHLGACECEAESKTLQQHSASTAGDHSSLVHQRCRVYAVWHHSPNTCCSADCSPEREHRALMVRCGFLSPDNAAQSDAAERIHHPKQTRMHHCCSADSSAPTMLHHLPTHVPMLCKLLMLVGAEEGAAEEGGSKVDQTPPPLPMKLGSLQVCACVCVSGCGWVGPPPFNLTC